MSWTAYCSLRPLLGSQSRGAASKNGVCDQRGSHVSSWETESTVQDSNCGRGLFTSCFMSWMPWVLAWKWVWKLIFFLPLCLSIPVTKQSGRLIKNENIMLQTLGFDIAIEHPHTFVVKTCELVRASKDLAQTCYFMATQTLHLTTLCLQHRPTVVACVCIHLACKWSNWEIPKSTEGKDWFLYVDPLVTIQKLEELTQQFLDILEKCPSRLKKKVMSGGQQSSETSNSGDPSSSKVCLLSFTSCSPRN